MKFAIVNNQKVEAEPGAAGQCIGCGQSVIAKCGEIKVWHWAHKGKRNCDTWWEPETEWHRDWKNLFPRDWQEIRHIANSSEIHIADVKTEQGWVIEFQHSPIHPEERRARDSFYEKLVWVIDGTRRERYHKQFFKALEDGVLVVQRPFVKQVYMLESTLLSEWRYCHAPIFFDFGKDQPLWCFLPEGDEAWGYVMAFSRSEFLEIHRAKLHQPEMAFEKILNMLKTYISNQRELGKIRTTQSAQQFRSPLMLRRRLHRRL